MIIPGRNYNNTAFRFGFNNKEKDDEINGIGNSLDFGARIYASRLGRWLSLDPLQTKYPSLSPYSFGANSPIYNVDPDGKKITYYITIIQADGSIKTVTVKKDGFIIEKVTEQQSVGMGGQGIVLPPITNTHVYDGVQNITIDQRNNQTKITYGQLTKGVERNSEASGKLGDYIEKAHDYYNSFVSNDKEGANGGISWTSKEGQAQETKRGSPDAEINDVDGLLGLIRGAWGAGHNEQIELGELKGILDAAKKAAHVAHGLAHGVELGHDTKEQFNELRNDESKKTPAPDSVVEKRMHNATDYDYYKYAKGSDGKATGTAGSIVPKKSVAK